MEETTQEIDPKTLFDLTKRNRWEELEELWLRLIANPPADTRFYERLIAGMIKRNATDRCGQMLGLLVQTLAEEGKTSQALKIALACLKPLPSSEPLREAIVGALKRAYGARENFARFMAVAKIETNPDIRRALSAFLLYCNYDVGESFQHKSWGVGTVTAIDPDEKKLTLRFPERPAAEFTLGGAKEYLHHLPRTHLLARLSREPEQMKELARREPAQLAKIAIKSLGQGLKIADLRLEMCRYLMGDAEWKDWWARSRDHIRVDPYIAFRGSGINATLTLRDKPRNAHDQALAALLAAESPRRRMDAVRGWVRVSARLPVVAERLAEAERWALDQFRDATTDPQRAEMLFVLDGLRRIDGPHMAPPSVSLRDIAAQTADPLGLILGLGVFEYQAPALDALRETRADWRETYETLLPDLPVRLATRAAKALLDGEHFENLRHASEGLLTNPRRNVYAHLWALSEFVHGRWSHFAPALSIDLLMEHLLEYLTELFAGYDPRAEDGPETRSRINAIRGFLEENQHANTRKAASLMSADGARRFYERLAAHPGLDDSERAHLSAALRAERPELDVKAAEDLLTSAYFYATQDSRERRIAEVQRIRQVEIPQNSDRIAKARAHGDLSENAEYDAAKEEQGRLMRRLSELEEDLRFVRILDPAHIPIDQIMPGARVRLRYDSGGEANYTVLGPWDADPEHDVLSYRSPVGAQFLKKKVGETFDLVLPSGERRRCTIEAIENALA